MVDDNDQNYLQYDDTSMMLLEYTTYSATVSQGSQNDISLKGQYLSLHID